MCASARNNQLNGIFKSVWFLKYTNKIVEY